jgi:hypothetical protein
MDRQAIIYSLNIEDIQTVALEELGREMTGDKINRITDVISNAIMEKINQHLIS